MILSCLKYQSRIIQLAETMAVLTKFYNQRLPFWQGFIDQMQAFETNLTKIKTDKQIFQNIEDFPKSSNHHIPIQC